jgi:hypothetical protein
MKKKRDKTVITYEGASLLKPLKVTQMGTRKDPCFGKLYDLTEKDCKVCGDSELCSITFTQKMGIQRKDLEESKKFKDLEILLNKRDVRIFIRKLKKKEVKRSEIINQLMGAFVLTQPEAKLVYKKYKPKNKK